MATLLPPIEKNSFYHIYNRGNAGTYLFYNKGNYEFFLNRYAEHLSPFVDTFALCLLPNHFHLLVYIKETVIPLDLPGFEKLAGLNISQAFSNLFNSYSKAINKQRNRHGSLFEKPFRRKRVNNTKYLANLVCYIHANPQLHGIAKDFRQYPWSSYERILKNSPTRLQKDAVLEWFKSKENYINYHQENLNFNSIQDLLIDG
jgi:REP element-mobilizing transposase RayT